MLKNVFKDYVYPVTVFAGGMIGVGFLSLPYVASRVGVWIMLVYFLVITALVLIINSMFCKISLKTPDFKRFPGFVGYYLGKWPKFIAMLSMIFGVIGVLLVYLLVGGKFLTSALQPFLAGNILIYTLIYFLITSIIIYLDIKVVARVEFSIIILLLLSVIFIFIECLPQINLGNLELSNFKLQISNLFLPYGPLLFALWGIGLIPEVEEMLKTKKNNLKKIVTIATLIVSVFYFVFMLLVLSITGTNTDETALGGLKNFLGDGATSVVLLIGALATFTAFITQGIILKKTIMFDLGIKHWQAFVITCFTPMVLFLFGVNYFIPLISLIGGVLLGIDGILILLIYKKINGKNTAIYSLSLVFLLGIIYELIYFIK